MIQPHQHFNAPRTVSFILLGALASIDLLAMGALPSSAESSLQAANFKSGAATIRNSCSVAHSVASTSAPFSLSSDTSLKQQNVTAQDFSVSQLPKLQAAFASNASSDIILADQTPVKLKFKEEISSKKVKQFQEINLEVSEDVVVQDVTIIAKGAQAKGCVAEVQQARMMGHKGRLSIVLTEVQLVSGEMIALRGTDSKEGGTAAARMALSSLVAPFFLLMAGKEAKYAVGTELTAFVDGDRTLDTTHFISPGSHP